MHLSHNRQERTKTNEGKNSILASDGPSLRDTRWEQKMLRGEMVHHESRRIQLSGM